MTSTPYRYERAGLLVESEWPLPGLMAARAGGAPLGQLSIRRGRVPQELPGGVCVDPITQAAPGLLLLKHPSAGRFLVRNGSEIVAEPAADDLGDLRPFILSSGFAAICIQQGLVLLHASAAVIDGAAVAFAGPSGAGKSTLLGAFVASGHSAIADDLSLVESGAEFSARIWPSSGYLRLWPDSVRALGFDERPASPELSWSSKLQLSLETTVVDGPRPLSAVCLLTGEEAELPSIEPIETAAAMAELAKQLFRPHYIHPLGKLASLLVRLGKIVVGIRVFRVSRPTSYDHLQTMIEAIKRTLQQGDERGFELSY
jgi:energy-coupling factor transporter ATP-binding protein EcfA2